MAELQSKISLNLKEYLNQLQKAVELTTKAVQEMSGDGVKLGVDADGLSSVQKEIDSLIGSLSDQNIVINADSSGIDQASKKVSQLDSETATPKIKTDDSSVDATKKKIDELDGTTVNVGVETSGLSGLTDALSGGLIGGAIGGGLAGFAQAGIEAVVAGFGEAINMGLEFNSALGDMQAKTGATAKEMELLEQASKDAFLGGVGESVAEATNIIANAQLRLGDFLDPKELGTFTTQAQALANTFDLDVNEVLAKSAPLIKQYGLTGQEAFETLAYSLKNGANAQDDVLDSFAEYSQLAQEAGLSAQQFGALVSKAGSDGAFNTDKLLDSLKEAQIRIKAGDYNTAFQGLSDSANGAEKDVIKLVKEIVDKGASGDLSIADSLSVSTQEIEKAFNAGQISDTLRTQLQVAIAGTPAEDLGADLFANAFSDINATGLDAELKKAGASVTGAIGQYTSFESITRQFELFITEFSQKLIAFSDAVIAPIFGGVIEILGGIKDAFDDTFGDFELGSGFTDGLQGLIGLFNIIVGLVRDRISAVFRAVFGTIKGIIESVYTAFEPIVSIISDIINSFSGAGSVFEDFGNIMKDVGDIVGLVGGFIFDLLITPFELLIDIIVDSVRWVGDFIGGLFGVGDAGKLFSTIIDKIGTGLTNVKGTIAGVIEAFKAFKAALKNLDFGKVVSDLLSGKNPFESFADDIKKGYNKGFNEATKTTKDNLEEQGKLFEKLNKQIEALASNRDNLSNEQLATEKKNIATSISSNLEANKLLKNEAVKLENALEQIKVKGNLAVKKDADKLADYMNTTFKEKLKNAFVIDGLKFELKTDFVSETDIQAFIEKVESGINPIEALGTAITGLTLEQKQLDAIDEYKKKIEELRASFVAITVAPTETPEYIKNIVQGQEEFISQISKYAGEANSVINNLNNQKVDLQLQFNQSDSDEEKAKILSQIDSINAQIITKTIATSKTTNDDRKRLETEYAQFLINNKSGAIEVITNNANKEIEVLDDKKKKAIDIETELQSKIAELNEQGQRRLKELQLENASEDERNKYNELQSLDDKYEQEVEKFKGQTDVLLAISHKYQLDKLNLEKKYNKESTGIYDQLIDSFSDSFSNLDLSGLVEKHDEVIGSINEVESNYKDQTKTLQEQLKSQEISQRDYNEEIIKLEAEKNEKIKELEKDKFDFIDALNLGLAESFKNLSDKYTEAITKQIEYTQSFIEKREQLDNQFKLGQLTQEQYTEKTTALNSEYDESITTTYENAAIAMGASTLQMIISGEKASKAVIVTALNTLKSLIPIFTAQIFGVEVGKLGVFGLITAGALTATLTGLAALAGGANKGVVGMDDSFKGKKNHTDTKLVWVDPNESYINSKATMKNKDFLTWINDTGKHWTEYPALSNITVGENGLNYITPDMVKQTSNLVVNNVELGSLGGRIDQTNRELKVQSKKLDMLYEKFGNIDVRHFHNKQPTVNNNVKVEIKDSRGRL